MAIRTVTWTVGSDGTTVTPITPQNGGVQGEENATMAVFRFGEESPLADSALQLYIECMDNAGGYDKTPPLTVMDGQVSVPVPLAWTQYGGISTLRLVGEQDGNILYTLEGRLRFASRQTAARQVDGLLRTHIQQTLNEVETAAVTAEVSAEKAKHTSAEAMRFVAVNASNALVQKIYSDGMIVVKEEDVSPFSETLQMRVRSKNLIPFPYPELRETDTVNGITYTVREDGSILVDGTATAKTSLFLLRGWEPELGQVYYHSGCPAGGGYTTYQLQLEATDGSFTRFDLGEGAINSFKVEKEGLTIDLYIDIYAGVTLRNAVFYPQLELGEEATAYAKYLVDPTVATVHRHGRNLFDPTCVLAERPAGFPEGCPVYYLKCAPNTAYYISRAGAPSTWLVATTSDEPGVGMPYTILSDVYGTTHSSIVTPFDARYLVLAMGHIDKLQVELGTVQTEYTPYTLPRVYVPEADGTVIGVDTVEWDTLFEIAFPGAVLECDYNRDINSGFAALETMCRKNKPPLNKDNDSGVVQIGTDPGRGNEACDNSTALGGWNKVRKGYSLADGWGNQVDAETSAAFGAYNLLRGTANFASGRSNEIRGCGGASSLGQDNVAAADSAVTLGQNLLATDPAQLVAGRNNADEPGALFIVGNGDVHRHNALAVLEDGSLMAGAGFETAVRYADNCVLQTFEGVAAGTALGLSVTGGTIQATKTENGTVAEATVKTSSGGVRPQMLLTDSRGEKLWVEQGESFTLSFKMKAGSEDTLARKLFYWLCVTERETGFTNTEQKNACVVWEESNIPFATNNEWVTVTATVTECPYSGWLRMGISTGKESVVDVVLLDDILLMRGGAVVYHYIAKNGDYATTLYKLCEVQSVVDKTEAWLAGRTLHMADGSEIKVDAGTVAASQREDRLDNLGNTILLDENGEVLLAIVTRICPDDPEAHPCMDVHEHGIYVSLRVAGVTYEKALSRRIDVSAGDGGGVVVDNTLTQTGFAADAAVTGRRLDAAAETQTAIEGRLEKASERIAELEEKIEEMEAMINLNKVLWRGTAAVTSTSGSVEVNAPGISQYSIIAIDGEVYTRTYTQSSGGTLYECRYLKNEIWGGTNTEIEGHPLNNGDMIMATDVKRVHVLGDTVKLFSNDEYCTHSWTRTINITSAVDNDVDVTCTFNYDMEIHEIVGVI